jgi:hypothetical protein
MRDEWFPARPADDPTSAVFRTPLVDQNLESDAPMTDFTE